MFRTLKDGLEQSTRYNILKETTGGTIKCLVLSTLCVTSFIELVDVLYMASPDRVFVNCQLEIKHFGASYTSMPSFRSHVSSRLWVGVDCRPIYLWCLDGRNVWCCFVADLVRQKTAIILFSYQSMHFVKCICLTCTTV